MPGIIVYLVKRALRGLGVFAFWAAGLALFLTLIAARWAATAWSWLGRRVENG